MRRRLAALLNLYGSHDYTSPTFDIYAKKIVIEAEAPVASDVFDAPDIVHGLAQRGYARELPAADVRFCRQWILLIL